MVFHLQTRSPPILPPICELFDLPAESIAERPLHMGHLADEIHLTELLKVRLPEKSQLTTRTADISVASVTATDTQCTTQHLPFDSFCHQKRRLRLRLLNLSGSCLAVIVMQSKQAPHLHICRVPSTCSTSFSCWYSLPTQKFFCYAAGI